MDRRLREVDDKAERSPVGRLAPNPPGFGLRPRPGRCGIAGRDAAYRTND
jgi:hypothetical protein